MVKFGLAQYVHRLHKSTLSARNACSRSLIFAFEESIDDRIMQGLIKDECTTMQTQSYLIGVLVYGGYKWGKRGGRAGSDCLGDLN